MIEIAVGRYRPQPAAVRAVAEVVSFDERERAHAPRKRPARVLSEFRSRYSFACQPGPPRSEPLRASRMRLAWLGVKAIVFSW